MKQSVSVPTGLVATEIAGVSFASLDPETAALITNDAERFKKAIKDTRNWMTHLERHKRSKPFPTPRWHDACEQMELLLMILMLKHCGLPEDRIRKRVVDSHRDNRCYEFPEVQAPAPHGKND